MWKPEHLIRRHLASRFFPNAIFHDVNILKQILRDWVEVGERMPLNEKKKFRGELEIIIRPPPSSSSTSSFGPPMRKFQPHRSPHLSPLLQQEQQQPFVYRVPMDLWLSLLPWDVQRGLSKADLATLFSFGSPSSSTDKQDEGRSSSSSTVSFPSSSPLVEVQDQNESENEKPLRETTEAISKTSEEEEDSLGVLFGTDASEGRPPTPSSSWVAAALSTPAPVSAIHSSSSSFSSSSSSSSLSTSFPVPGMLFVLEVPPLHAHHGNVCFWSGAITAPIDVLFFRPFTYSSASSSVAVVTSPIANIPIPLSSPSRSESLVHTHEEPKSTHPHEDEGNPRTSLLSVGKCRERRASVDCPHHATVGTSAFHSSPSSGEATSWSFQDGGRGMASPSTASLTLLRREGWEDGGFSEVGRFSSAHRSRNSPMALRTQDWNDRVSAGEAPLSPEVAASFFPSVEMLLEIAPQPFSLSVSSFSSAKARAAAPQEEEGKLDTHEPHGVERDGRVENNPVGQSFPPLPLHDVGHLDPFPSPSSAPLSSFLGSPDAKGSPTHHGVPSTPLCHQVRTKSASPDTPPHYVMECPRYLLQECIRTAYDRYRYYHHPDCMSSPSPWWSWKTAAHSSEQPPNTPSTTSCCGSSSSSIQETVEVYLHLSPSLSREILSQSQMVVGYVKALRDAIDVHLRQSCAPPAPRMAQDDVEEGEEAAAAAGVYTRSEEKKWSPTSTPPFAASVLPVEETEGQPPHGTPSFLHPLHSRAFTPASTALDAVGEDNGRQADEAALVLPTGTAMVGPTSTPPSRHTASLYGGGISVAAAVLAAASTTASSPSHRAKHASLYPLTHAPPSSLALLRPPVDYELIALIFRLGVGWESVLRHYYERLLRDWRREVLRLRRHARRHPNSSLTGPAPHASSCPSSSPTGYNEEAVAKEEEEGALRAQDVRLFWDLVRDPALQFPEELGSLVEVVAEARGLSAASLASV